MRDFRVVSSKHTDGTPVAIMSIDAVLISDQIRGLMKILIATDGSRFSEAAIGKACEFAKGMENLSIKVISIYEAQVPVAAEPYALSAEYYQRLDDFAQQKAEEAAKNGVDLLRNRLSDASAEITTLVELGRPAQIIVENAESWGADLIVVGSHGYGFWSRLALGSVSDAVTHHAPCSVLVVRSQSREKEK